MQEYRNVLIKELIFVSIIVAIAVIVCIVGFILIKKLALEKVLYIFLSVFLVITIVFGGGHILNLSLDLTYDSFETYTGEYKHPSRDTLILVEQDNMKLNALITIPDTPEDLTIVYSKRSKIVVGYQENK